jgi:hypothetical protein
MANIDRTVEVADLDAVAHFEDDLVLYIDSEFQNIPPSLCVRANFDTRQFDPVQPMSVYLELNPYLPIEDEDTRISYRKRIQEEMSPEATDAMLRDFTEKEHLILENLGISTEDFIRWQPGG